MTAVSRCGPPYGWLILRRNWQPWSVRLKLLNSLYSFHKSYSPIRMLQPRLLDHSWKCMLGNECIPTLLSLTMHFLVIYFYRFKNVYGYSYTYNRQIYVHVHIRIYIVCWLIHYIIFADFSVPYGVRKRVFWLTPPSLGALYLRFIIGVDAVALLYADEVDRQILLDFFMMYVQVSTIHFYWLLL